MGPTNKKKQDNRVNIDCVVCNSVVKSPETYTYNQKEKTSIFATVKRGNAFTIALEVPICLTCRKKFQRWSLYNLGSNGIYVMGVVCVIISIFFLIFHQLVGEIGVPLLSIGFLIIISGLILHFIVGKVSSNPSNYFYYDFLSNNFYVKPIAEADWVLYKK